MRPKKRLVFTVTKNAACAPSRSRWTQNYILSLEEVPVSRAEYIAAIGEDLPRVMIVRMQLMTPAGRGREGARDGRCFVRVQDRGVLGNNRA